MLNKSLPSSLLSLYILVGSTVLFSSNALATIIILDNDTTGFTYTPQSYWTNSSAISGHYGSDYKVDLTDGADVGEAAKWTPTITTAGYYKIYMRWSAYANRPDAAPVQIQYKNGARLDTRYVNQQQNGGKWVYLGAYYFGASGNDWVKIQGSDAGYTVADSVKFELSKAIPSAPSDEPMASPTNLYSMTHDVKIVQTPASGAFQFSVDGSIYYVKGIDGYDAQIASAGANTLRTYSTLGVGGLSMSNVLDNAAGAGMKVMVGLWMNHETGSFNYYDDTDEVASQLSFLKGEVDKYKTHPAVLCWGVGNEVDKSTSAHPEAIYKAMNDLAKYIHEVDPYHPTVSCHAGSSTNKISGIMTYCPHVDVVAFNSYKHIGNVSGNVAVAGWVGPYSVTEFGVDMPMESTDTSWGAPFEQDSYDKYNTYYSRYTNYITGNVNCIGGFVFNEYNAFRVTHTWYNLYLAAFPPSDPPAYTYKTPSYDAMYRAWTGSNPTDLAPRIQLLYVNGYQQPSEITLSVDTEYRAIVGITQDQGEDITYVYEIREEATSVEKPVLNVTFTVDPNDERAVFFTTSSPLASGKKYRLYAYAYDETDHVGTANLPFEVVSSARGVVTDSTNGPKLSISQLSEGVAISWLSQVGHTYQVQSCDSLAGGVWSDVGLPTVGSGAVVTMTNLFPETSVGSRFYRVVER